MTATAEVPTAAAIRRFDHLDPVGTEWAWHTYRQRFAQIDAYAVQRHLMTRDEFDVVATDRRISKHLAFATDGTLVGMSVITNNLWAWPLISPAYFARRWPAHHRQNRIFYVGFVMTADGAPLTTFRDLIADMARPVFATRGIAVMDFCATNIERGVHTAADRILHRLNPHTEHVALDAQEFHAWRFDDGTGS